MATSRTPPSSKSPSSTNTKVPETSDLEEWQIVEYKPIKARPIRRSYRYSPYERSSEKRSQDSKLVLLHGREMYFATASDRAIDDDGQIIWPAIKLADHPIAFENLWPKPMRSATLAPNPIPEWMEVSRPRLFDFGDGYRSERDKDVPRKQLHREFQVSEDVRKDPHPNLITYHGCVMHGDLITGLCYTRHEKTLHHRMLSYREKPFDIEKCLDGILHGMCHLHGIGYLHNGLHPSNVMMDSKDNPVITDFSSCTREGQHLDIRYCHRAWQGRNYNRFRATKSNDFGNLTRLREYLTGVANGSRSANVL